jgi:formate dehydrogenase major subunit
MPADVKTDTVTITLTIDGKSCQGVKGQTILEVAKDNGVDIPTLCHHKWLTNHGACRMCVVEVEGQRRLVTACAAPAEDGQIIVAHNEKLSLMRQMTLELLFAERNHICPFCPASGVCELQNRAYEEGITHTRYKYLFPVLEPDCSNPNFVQDHNRCILCGRCVRACGEVVGVGTLGFGNRGTKEMVVADLGVPIGESTCISCGTCVDVCPTGSLFDKRSPYFSKSGDLHRQLTICPDDDMGCTMNVVLKSGFVARIEGTEAAVVNGPVLSRRARYELMDEPTPRLLDPLLRNADGQLVKATWDEALDAAAKALAAADVAPGAHVTAGLASGRLPLETLATFQRFIMETCASGDVDTFRGGERQTRRAARDLYLDHEECGFDAIKEADLVLLVGIDPLRTHQVLGAWLAKKWHNEQCPIISVNARQSKVADLANVSIKPRRGSEHEVILGLLCQLLEVGTVGLRADRAAQERWRSHPVARVAAEAHVKPEELVRAAALYAKAHKPVILYGPELGARGNPTIIGRLWEMASCSGHRTEDGALRVRGFETEANAAGAEELGFRGADPGSAQTIYLLQGDDSYDPPAQLEEDLGRSPLVILQASHEGPLLRHADIVLPSLKWSERGGTWVNVTGLRQTFEPCTTPPAGVRADEAVLADLAARIAAVRTAAIQEVQI